MENLFLSVGIDYRELNENEGISIEDKNIKIKSFNHNTNKMEYKQISRLLRKSDSEMFEVNSNNYSFKATPEHKIFTKEFGYIELKDIKSNCSILFDDGKFYPLTLKKLDGKFPVLDMTVEDNQNYYSNKMLSHNSPEKYGIGESMKFNASVRIKVTKKDAQKNDINGQSSVIITANVFKNKVGVPFKKAEFTLLTGRLDDNGEPEYGIDIYQETLDYAVRFNLIQKAGSWFSYGEERLGQGSGNVIKFFKQNNDVYEKIKLQILEKLEETRQKSQGAGNINNSITDAVEGNKKRRTKKSDENMVSSDVLSEPETIDAEIVED